MNDDYLENQRLAKQILDNRSMLEEEPIDSKLRSPLLVGLLVAVGVTGAVFFAPWGDGKSEMAELEILEGRDAKALVELAQNPESTFENRTGALRKALGLVESRQDYQSIIFPVALGADQPAWVMDAIWDDLESRSEALDRASSKSFRNMVELIADNNSHPKSSDAKVFLVQLDAEPDLGEFLAIIEDGSETAGRRSDAANRVVSIRLGDAQFAECLGGILMRKDIPEGILRILFEDLKERDSEESFSLRKRIAAQPNHPLEEEGREFVVRELRAIIGDENRSEGARSEAAAEIVAFELDDEPFVEAVGDLLVQDGIPVGALKVLFGELRERNPEVSLPTLRRIAARPGHYLAQKSKELVTIEALRTIADGTRSDGERSEAAREVLAAELKDSEFVKHVGEILVKGDLAESTLEILFADLVERDVQLSRPILEEIAGRPGHLLARKSAERIRSNDPGPHPRDETAFAEGDLPFNRKGELNVLGIAGDDRGPIGSDLRIVSRLVRLDRVPKGRLVRLSEQVRRAITGSQVEEIAAALARVSSFLEGGLKERDVPIIGYYELSFGEEKPQFQTTGETLSFGAALLIYLQATGGDDVAADVAVSGVLDAKGKIHPVGSAELESMIRDTRASLIIVPDADESRKAVDALITKTKSTIVIEKQIEFVGSFDEALAVVTNAENFEGRNYAERRRAFQDLRLELKELEGMTDNERDALRQKMSELFERENYYPGLRALELSN